MLTRPTFRPKVDAVSAGADAWLPHTARSLLVDGRDDAAPATDPDVLAANQGRAGVQGHKIADDGDVEVRARPCTDGGAAMVLFKPRHDRRPGRAPA